MLPFETEHQAQAALEGGEIQAYYVLSEDYFETREVELVYREEPGTNATRQFYDFIQVNLLADLPLKVANRAAVGENLVIRSPDGSRDFPENGPQPKVVLPILVSTMFIGLSLFSTGFLMEGMVAEKENRTVEVLFTSVSVQEMIRGKILGIVAIGFTQLLGWVLLGCLAFYAGAYLFDVAWFQNLQVDWGVILVVLAIAIPSYVTAAALMFTLGATLAESQEGQSVGGFLYLLYMLPTLAIVAIARDVNGPTAVVLTILPFTSLLTISLRNVLTPVPVWQVGASIAVQVCLAVGSLWLAARAFRLGMLRYGRRLNWRELFRGSREAWIRLTSPGRRR